jgi:hypothetical protein
LPAMPRAGDDIRIELALAERSSLVRTDAIEGVQSPSNIKNRHDPRLDDRLQYRAGGAIGDLRGYDPTTHRVAPQ